MSLTTESKILAQAIEGTFGLNNVGSPDEEAYQSLSLCLLDAVFSIGVKYEQVTKVVERYCDRYSLRRRRKRYAPLPPETEQDSISDLLLRIDSIGPNRFAKEVLRNRGRTSPASGILKAKAVREFASALAAHGVERLQDLSRAMRSKELEHEIRQIPGQRSGISLRYFFMEAGCDDLVKPDRMIQRYLQAALHREVRVSECHGLVSSAAEELKREYPRVTPRSLDFMIWQHQRKVEGTTEADAKARVVCRPTRKKT